MALKTERSGVLSIPSRTLTIDASPDRLLEAWCDPEVQQQVLGDLAQLSAGDRKHMQWQVSLPGDRTVEVASELVDFQPGVMAHHRSTGPHGVEMDLVFAVAPAPADFGTEATVRVECAVPGGALATTAAKLLGSAPEMLVGRALRRLKALIEAGEIPTLDLNPSARAAKKQKETH
jgi:uncharacterized membrane protein